MITVYHYKIYNNRLKNDYFRNFKMHVFFRKKVTGFF